MRRTFAAALFLGTLALTPISTRAGEGDHSLEQLVVEMAHTPADHAALAAHFRAKAADARAEAKRHEGMGRAYSGGKMMDRERMKRHCKKIADDSNAIAAEYDELAKLHDAESKKTE